MAISHEDLERYRENGVLDASSALVVPGNGDMHPALSSDIPTDLLLQRFYEQLTSYGTSIETNERGEVTLRYSCTTRSATLDTDPSHMPGSGRPSEAEVIILPSGETHITIHDVGDASEQDVPALASSVTYSFEPSATPGCIRLAKTEQWAMLGGVPTVTHTTTYAYREDGTTEQQSTFGEETQELNDLLFGLYNDDATPDDMRALFGRLREQEALGRGDVVVTPPDVEGRQTAIVFVYAHAGVYAYKFILGADGRLEYIHLAVNGLLADPIARNYAERIDGPMVTIPEFDTSGRIAQKTITKETASLFDNRPVTQVTVRRFSYTEVPLAEGGSYIGKTVSYIMHDGDVHIERAFDFTTVLTQLIVDKDTMQWVAEGMRVVDTALDGGAEPPKTLGSKFRREFIPGKHAAESLVLVMEVVEADGQLVCQVAKDGASVASRSA